MKHNDYQNFELMNITLYFTCSLHDFLVYTKYLQKLTICTYCFLQREKQLSISFKGMKLHKAGCPTTEELI